MTQKTPGLKVSCYSGYKANEKPISFEFNEDRRVIKEVINQWRSPDFAYFKVLADNGKAYLLRHDLREDTWALEKIYQERDAS